jgi:hypothetical protein
MVREGFLSEMIGGDQKIIQIKTDEGYSRKTSTDEGRMLPTKTVPKNAYLSICDN